MKKYQKTPNHRLYFTTLLFLFAPNVFANNPVEIAPTISAGEGKTYSEAEGNLWFMLDDSGSMKSDIPYDASITYQIPLRTNGTKFEFHKGEYYYEPFIEDASGKDPESYNDNYDYGSVCQWHNPRKNCLIWKSFYSTRMKALKSSLSLAINAKKNKDKLSRLRIGYRAFTDNSDEILPVRPLYGNDGKTNKKNFLKWLYKLKPETATPIRKTFSEIFRDITSASKLTTTNDPSGKNPFLITPGKSSSKENHALTCRRNYLLVMTDGSWNNDSNDEVNNTLSEAGINLRKLSKKTTFPDKHKYQGQPPFYVTRWNNKQVDTTLLSDLAFTAWANDLDGKDNNNTLHPIIRKDKDGKDKINPNVSANPSYWHPHNDPAKWQHINTYTMGFGLSDGNIDVNSDKILLNAVRHLNTAQYCTTGYKWCRKKYIAQAIYEKSAAKDLASAAVSGRGRYYNAQKPTDLINAFDDLFKSTESTGEKSAVRGSAGAVGVNNIGNSYYVSRYFSQSFTGELAKYELFKGTSLHANTCFTKMPTILPAIGTLCDKPLWNAGELLTDGTNSQSLRHFITSKRSYKNKDLTNMTMGQFGDKTAEKIDIEYKINDFKKANFSPSQRSRLLSDLPNEFNKFGNDNKKLNALIDYIKGSPTNENIFRNRGKHEFEDKTARNILGAIVRSSPAYVGIPSAYIGHLDPTSQTYQNYVNELKFYIKKSKPAGTTAEKCQSVDERCKDEIIYVGANDGMLHAFKATDGSEVFAYLPSAIYDVLPKTVERKKQISMIDGNIDTALVDDNTEWKRVLLGSMGGGAKGIYALNITDPNPEELKKQTDFIWEYGEFESKIFQKTKQNQNPKSNIGNILAKPAIIRLDDGTLGGKWVAILGNGYNSESGKAAVIVVDLKTGKGLQELVLPNAQTFQNKPNGLGPLYFIRRAGKTKGDSQFYDRAYAGDLHGNLWVFNFINNGTAGVKLGVVNNKPLFTATYKNSDNKVKQQSITVYPIVRPHPSGYGYLVHFGTGALFARDDFTSKVTNSIYAIWDDWVSKEHGGLTLDEARTQPIEKCELQSIKYTEDTLSFINKDGKPTKKTIRQLGEKDTSTNEFKNTNTKIVWNLDSEPLETDRCKNTTNGIKMRGWRIDLKKGERSWQPAVAYLPKNAIIYNTARYVEPDDESTSTASVLTCETEGGAIESYEMAFNDSDGGAYLSNPHGYLDTTGDGQSNQGDVTTTDKNDPTKKTIIPPSMGLLNTNNIGITPSFAKPPIPTTIKPIAGACRSGTATVMIKPTLTGKISTASFQNCSTFSSWNQLN